MQYLCKKYSLTETVYSYMEKIGWQLDQPEKLELLYRNTQTRYKITPRRGERYSNMTGCQFFFLLFFVTTPPERMRILEGGHCCGTWVFVYVLIDIPAIFEELPPEASA